MGRHLGAQSTSLRVLKLIVWSGPYEFVRNEVPKFSAQWVLERVILLTMRPDDGPCHYYSDMHFFCRLLKSKRGATFATNPGSRAGGPDHYYSNTHGAPCPAPCLATRLGMRARGAVRITIVMVRGFVANAQHFQQNLLTMRPDDGPCHYYSDMHLFVVY